MMVALAAVQASPIRKNGKFTLKLKVENQTILHTKNASHHK